MRLKKNCIFYSIIIIGTLSLVSSCASNEKILSKIEKRKYSVKEKFRNFSVSCLPSQDFSNFYHHEKVYNVNADINKVWEAYTHISAKEMWSGPLNKFKEAYSQKDTSAYIRKDAFVPSPEVGTIYELKLKIIRFLKIPVNFEITKISQENKIIEFTYGAENKSKGMQTLTFLEIDSTTRIVHQSYFYSGNKFRDKKLYPKYHEKCLNEFHDNLKSHILSTSAK
jgi:hypothetical protein